MLNRIKQLAARGLTPIAALTMFIIMLPLTLALTMFMVVGGASLLAFMRYRLRKMGIDSQQDYAEKPPIEGSCTVVARKPMKQSL